MALLEVYIGQSKYTIDCEDKEQEKIKSLASKVNERVNKLSLQMRGADEKNILMLCAIMIEEELNSIKSLRINQETINSAISNENNNSGSKQDIEKIIAKNVNEVSYYIENLANKIKNS